MPLLEHEIASVSNNNLLPNLKFLKANILDLSL